MRFELTKQPSPDDLITSSGRYSGFWKEIFQQAEREKASDIHVEALFTGLHVRLRIDGELKIVAHRQDKEEIDNLLIAIKNISQLDTSTRRTLQDHGFELHLTRANYRVTLSPGGGDGEYLVFRIIRNEDIPSLGQLGLSDEARSDIEWAISQSQGFFLVTGPTGSGKSTTVQACLMQLDRDRKKIITMEDPIERKLKGVCHQRITKDFGWTDAAKGALRQDPDIIFFGEIRDDISAEYAVQAAQTGHLVMSTLHTNSVIDTIDRLFTLKIKDYLIADSLLFISAQRLMQALCSHCKVDYKGFFKRNPNGCDLCNYGLKGRVPIVEYCLKPDPGLILDYRKDELKKILKQTLLGELESAAKAGVVDFPTFENAARKGNF
jgi:type II secretory ATPase GspE/PulE/Tfp pilus assembly ATPase PilB-like protein